MITLDILEADATTLVVAVDMAAVVDGQTEDPIDPGGLGELSVGLESANRADLEVKGRVLRWNGTGTQPFHSLIEDNGQVSKAESHSQIPQQVTVRGRSLMGQWDDVRVGQWPGMDHFEVQYYTRHFNYASPGKASAINGTAYEHSLVLDFDAYGQPTNPAQPPPATWRDPTAMRIWTAAYSGSQTVGTSLFRTTMTPDATKVLRMHATADDRFVGWVGGVPVMKGPDFPSVGWHDTWPSTGLVIEDVTYDVVFRCENEFSVAPFSIAWLAVSGWLLDGSGSSLAASALEFHTDDTWDALDCTTSPVPGWIVPDILDVLLGEWQDQGGLTNWVVTDMTPGDWSEIPETTFETRKTTGFKVLEQLADGQAEFDVKVVAGVKHLRCYAPGTLGDYHTTPADPATLTDADITDLAHQWVQS